MPFSTAHPSRNKPGTFESGLGTMGESRADDPGVWAGLGGVLRQVIEASRSVLADRERVLDRSYPGTLNSRNNLAAACHTAGRCSGKRETRHEEQE